MAWPLSGRLVLNSLLTESSIPMSRAFISASKSEARLEATMPLQCGVVWVIQRWGFVLEGPLYVLRYLVSMGVSYLTACCRSCYAILLDHLST
ncbi:uncharacterized protein BJ212DRAFT_123314 [Suillus subaureus]|uniref:Uncharacterized protein n=1 Tax=Suillus subaureus TaxID=48587 RepID=A0A9P7EDD5_9AGAM|nr:uncharacterized protein BJ212DRAFT_123314 [Suillus subaureus]KAG1818083.1 hypothetical protein BJ212DRAFT_123314 [Suillus subaureus]